MLNQAIRLTSAAVLAVGVFGGSAAYASDWEIDSSHAAAQFAVKHMMVSTVRGELGKVTGTVKLDEKDISKSTVEATIDVTAINTREPKRDAHLRSADFFETEKYKTITFKSKKVAGTGDKLKVTGDLTIHGVTKEVVLDVELTSGEFKDPWGNIKRGAVATTKINREDYGLKWNAALEAGGVVVGKEVAITIDVELNKKGATTAAVKR